MIDHQGFIAPAFAEQVGNRDLQAFLEQIVGVRAKAAAADVGNVAGGRKQGHARTRLKNRRHHGEIIEVAGAIPGIVGQQHVARLQRRQRIAGEELAHGGGHGVDVSRGSGNCLGEHAAGGVEHAGRQIARLPHHGGERGAHQCLRLLLDDGQQAVPDQLGFQRPAACLIVHAQHPVVAESACRGRPPGRRSRR